MLIKHAEAGELLEDYTQLQICHNWRARWIWYEQWLDVLHFLIGEHHLISQDGIYARVAQARHHPAQPLHLVLAHLPL